MQSGWPARLQLTMTVIPLNILVIYSSGASIPGRKFTRLLVNANDDDDSDDDEMVD